VGGACGPVPAGFGKISDTLFELKEGRRFLFANNLPKQFAEKVDRRGQIHLMCGV
jgi:hypothetical protein